MPEGPSSGGARRGPRLEPKQVREIAERIASRERHTVVAESFGVSVETVGAIKSGKRWAGVIDEDLRARMAVAHPPTVLNTDSARKVMTALEYGRSGRSIAEEFGISPSMVSAIKHGRTWSDLDPDLPARLAQKQQHGKVLSASQVGEMKQRLLEGWSLRAVAKEFGVSGSTVQAISQGKTWAEIEPIGSKDGTTDREIE